MYLTFENPVYLWYLASLPLLVITHFLALRGAKRRAMRFANFRALKRIAGDRFITRNYVILFIRLLVLTMLIFAAAGTSLWYRAAQSDTNFVVAIDTSSSMSAQDFEPTRLDVAKEYALWFLGSLGDQAKVGVLSFSGVTLVQQPLTDDHFLVEQAIGTITVTKAGGTDLPGAIITGTNLLLAEPEKGKAILILTDGSSTLGNFLGDSVLEAANYAAEHHVVVHAAGIGSQSSPIGYLPEYYNISATYNEDVLSMVTNVTGGLLVQARDEDLFADEFAFLMADADSTFTRMRVDLGLLVLGILLLFVEWGLINSRFRRIT